MELMSSLLLCALVALLPAVSGESMVKTNWVAKYNNSMLIRQKPSTHKKILLNINAPPLVNVVSELQSVFADHSCRECIECMERAMKAYKANTHVLNKRPSTEEIRNDVLSHSYKFDARRKRRDVDAKSPVVETSTKKPKSRKNKLHKTVTVTKYDVHGDVYALKIQESNIQVLAYVQNDTRISEATCQVYSIKKSFPCDTPEGELILTASKRKVNKKNNMEIENNKSTVTTEKTAFIFRKRQVDNSQIPENFNPSIEELY